MSQSAIKTQPDPLRNDPFEAEIAPPEPSEAAVRHLRLLWDRRGFLVRAAIAGVLLGTLIAFVIPKTYTSTTQLMPPDNQSGSGMALLAALTGRGGGLGSVAGDLLGAKSSDALFIGILHSRTVEDRLIAKYDLRKVYGVRLEQTARKALEANTSISEDRKSGIITIRVTDRDPNRAAAIAKSYTEELDHLISQLSTSSAHREREFLEERLRTVNIDLTNAEKDFSEFASKNTTIDIKEQGRAMVEAAATLEGQLIAAKSELEGLKQIYADNNVRVRSTQARIAELQNQIDKVGGATDGNLSAATQGGSIYPSIRKLPLLGVAYADLYRRTKVQEALFEALTQQYELAKVQEVKETPSVKVLDEAEIPEHKSFPPRLLIMVLGGFLAFASAMFWTILSAHWHEIDLHDPRKVLAGEIFHALNANMPWARPDGSPVQAATHRMWTRVIARMHSIQDREGSHEQL